jgi:NRPS condensation-like uncharacterized protein
MFPLPLTSFEEYMLCDERPAYPMTCAYRLRFAGFLDPPALQAALATVIQRHPMLGATVRPTRGGRWEWVHHPEWQPTLQWRAPLNPSGWPPTVYFDLTREPANRWWMLEREDGHDLVIQAHHCCADALGMSQVMQDLLVAYAIHLGTRRAGPSLPALDPRRLLRRGAPGWRLSAAPGQAVGLLGVHEFLMRSPSPLATEGKVALTAVSPVCPGVHVRELDTEETRTLLATARSLRVTLNDLLLREVFLTVSAWRKERGLGEERDWLRFAMLINLRTPADVCMPATNSVSMVFLDRQERDLADAARLLASIHRQIQRIKRFQLQYTYLLSLRVARLAPGGLARMAQTDECRATSYFSNLGIVLGQTPLPRREGRLISGNVVLESADWVGFLRPQVHVGFVAYTYGGRLRFSLHYDPRLIAPDQSNDLLEMYVSQIRQTIQSAPVGNSPPIGMGE